MSHGRMCVYKFSVNGVVESSCHFHMTKISRKGSDCFFSIYFVNVMLVCILLRCQ